MDEKRRKAPGEPPTDPLDLPARHTSPPAHRPTAPGSAPSPNQTSPASTDVCKFFLKGACNRGASCSFLHPAELAIAQSKQPKNLESRSPKPYKGYGSANGEKRGTAASDGQSGGNWYSGKSSSAQSRGTGDSNHSSRSRPLTPKPHAFDKQASESWGLPGPSIDPSDNMSAGGSFSTPQLVLGNISFAPAWLGKKRAQQQQAVGGALSPSIGSASASPDTPHLGTANASLGSSGANLVQAGAMSAATATVAPQSPGAVLLAQIAPEGAVMSPSSGFHSNSSSSLRGSPMVAHGDGVPELESAHNSNSSRSLKSTSKSSISTLSTHTSGASGGSSFSLMSPITRTSGSSASAHSSTNSAETSSSSGQSSSSRDTSSSGSAPAPRIKKRMNTTTTLQQNAGQNSSMTDMTLLGGSMTQIHSGRGKKFPNKLAMMRWTQNFLGPGCDPTSVLLQREDLVELLQQPSLPFAVIAELMKIFAHHEFRDTGRTDRILQIVAESPLIRNPKNLKAHIIKLSGAHPPATAVYQENLSNTVDVISDIMDRYPQYIEILGLDILQISSQKIASAYPKHISEACEAIISKGKALLSEVGVSTIANHPVSALAFGSGISSSPINEHDEVGSEEEDEEDDEEHSTERRASPISSVDDFRDLPLFPTIHEIMDDSSAISKRLAKNIVKGKYDSLMHYLDTHFFLLREDAITSIRDGIKQYRNKRAALERKERPQASNKASEVSIYHSVRLTGICPTLGGIVYRVSFKLESDVGGAAKADKKTNAPSVDWKRSKRLLYGSLICISPDHFETLYWATVANRDVSLLSSSQEIDLKFPEEYQACLDPSLKYTMVESNSTYFEAYRHVLTALKSTNIHTFPFLDYLVHCKVNLEEPSYLKTGSAVYNLSNVFDGDASVLNILDQTWPASKIHTTMDDSQLSALKQALTKEIAVIQGPPGTGKTFVGLKVIRALLDNRDARGLGGTGPVLVVCYTNHALDQFLEGIMQFESNVVRIGSRSKSDLLKDRNLKSLLIENNTATVEHIRARRQLLSTMKEVQEMIENRFMDLCKTGLSSTELAQVFEDEEQIASLFGRDLGQEGEELALHTWLGLSTSELVKQSSKKPVMSQRHQSALFDAEFPALVRSGSGSSSASSSASSQKSAPMSPSTSSGSASGDWFDEEENEDDFLEQAEEIDRMVGDSVLLKMTQLKSEGLLTSDGSDPIDQALLTTNVWKLSKPDRQRLYIHWLREYRKRIVNPDLVDLCDRYEHLCSQKNVLDQDAQVQLLMSSAVIGLTTTGVAKFQKLIRAVGPPIVIVEEAAEVLEAHIVTAITPSTKHMILIGDHEQLRPTTAVYRLAFKYKLDVSLFERLIANGVPVKTLSRQRRMRPAIAALVAPIYPTLSNHPDVDAYPNVLGVSQNVFFVNHTMPESTDTESQGLSKTNPHEASFLARFASHLVHQGYSEKQVTILSAYSGQVKLIRHELRALNLHSVYVTSVDNYQGQECDIICLSLVRNNVKGIIGFLNTSNRICVALSRARIGMYVMGNAELLTSSNHLWRTVLGILRQNNCLGTALALQCQSHPEKRTMVATVADFKHCEDGGCDLKCPGTLDCGHACPRLCHPYPHSQVLCQRPCEKIHSECGHKCQRRCFQECGPCEIPVVRSLPCGHDCLLPCADEEALCNKMLNHTLPCTHTIQALCRELNPSKPGKAPKTYSCSQCTLPIPSN